MTAPVTIKVDKIRYPKKTKKEIFLEVLQWITLIKPLKFLFRLLLGRLGGKIVTWGQKGYSFDRLDTLLQELKTTKAADKLTSYAQSALKVLVKAIELYGKDKSLSYWQRRSLAKVGVSLNDFSAGKPLSNRARRKLIRAKKYYSKLAVLAYQNQIANKIDGNKFQQQIKLITPDKVTIDALKVSPRKTTSDIHVVYMLGLGGWYQSDLNLFQKEADHLGVTYYTFNYRGVGTAAKAPRGKRDMINDAIALVQHLIDSGIAPEKIYLRGFSLGASMASYVGAHFHRLEQRVYAYNQQSFGTVTQVALGFIRRIHQFIKYRGNKASQRNGHETSIFGRVLAVILAPLIKFLVVFSGWEINAAKAFKQIPPKYREHTLSKAPKGERHHHNENGKKQVMERDDFVISHYPAIHRSLKFERKKIEKSTPTRLNSHHELNKARKMRAGFNEGHTMSDDLLKSRKFGEQQHQVTSRQHFYSFVRAHNTVKTSNASDAEVALASIRKTVFGG